MVLGFRPAIARDITEFFRLTFVTIDWRCYSSFLRSSSFRMALLDFLILGGLGTFYYFISSSSSLLSSCSSVFYSSSCLIVIDFDCSLELLSILLIRRTSLLMDSSEHMSILIFEFSWFNMESTGISGSGGSCFLFFFTRFFFLPCL